MTTYSAALPTFTAGSTAALKDAMNSMSTLMTNAGWALAADTGQMDISAVTYNSASSTVYGYKIWYLNDSQHSTYPIYMRHYWKMAGTSVLAIYFTIGHATDGAGTITGVKFGSDSTFHFSGGTTTWGNSSNASKACSLDGFSFLTLAPVTTAYGNVQFFVLQREWDNSTGTIKSNGNYTFINCGASGANFPTYYSVDRASSTVISDNRYFCFVPGLTTSSQVGGTYDIFRHYFQYITYSVAGGSVTYHGAEITQWGTFTAQPLTGGSSRTYMATGIKAFSNATNTSTDCLAVLWE